MPTYTNLIVDARQLINDESSRRWVDAKIQEWLIQGCYQIWGMLPWGVLRHDYLRVYEEANATNGEYIEIEDVDTDIVFIQTVERKHTEGPNRWVGCRQISPLDARRAERYTKETLLWPTDDDPVWSWDYSPPGLGATAAIRVLPGDPASGYTGNYVRIRAIIQPDDTGGASTPEVHEYLHSSLPLFVMSQDRLARQDIQGAQQALSEFYSDVRQKVTRLYGNIR